MKAATEASTSAQANLACSDGGNVIQSISQVGTTVSVNPIVQPLSNGGPNAPASVQVDTTAVPVTDPSPCNGSGILVFQQKQTTPVNNAANNVPILVSLKENIFFIFN